MKNEIRKNMTFLALGLLGGIGLTGGSMKLLGQESVASEQETAYEKVAPDEKIDVSQISKVNGNRVIKGDDSSIGDAQMDNFRRIRQQMRKQMDQMMKGAFSSDDMFSADFGSGFGGGVQVTHDEDEEYKYIRINGEGMNPEDVKINIKDGMISISGEVKKVTKDESQGSSSSSTYISSFSQSFNVPQGVSEDVEVDAQDDGALVLKFKKKIM